MLRESAQILGEGKVVGSIAVRVVVEYLVE